MIRFLPPVRYQVAAILLDVFSCQGLSANTGSE
ncbi:hypothetical protein PANA5342_2929 [Pantoea ananatis LMG 5342]|nr:hypothetical protein PANA5342_2929 [Pantoea ananatis LMG 5342]